MFRLIALLLLFIAAGHARADESWVPSETGCFRENLGHALELGPVPDSSAASFWLAVQPDTGQGSTRFIALDSGKRINLGQPDPAPYVLVAAGLHGRTCVVRMPLSECPAAAAVEKRLAALSIPVGFENGALREILAFHVPTYYLGYVDGQGNSNVWRFSGVDHPLQPEIEGAMLALDPCISRAVSALAGR